MPGIGERLLATTFEHWLTRGERAKQAELRQLQLDALKRQLAEETRLGEIYPTGFEPTPSTQELTLTPAEEELQPEAYVPPPTTPPQTKMGYPGLTLKDIGSLHKIGLTALPPTKEKPRGQVLPTGLVKAVEAPTPHYEKVTDEEGNVIGTRVFEGGKLVRQVDIAGKEVPLGTALTPQVAPKPRLSGTAEEALKGALPPQEGFVNVVAPVHDAKGKILGYEAKPQRDPTFPVPSAEESLVKKHLQHQKMLKGELGEPNPTEVYQEITKRKQELAEAQATGRVTGQFTKEMELVKRQVTEPMVNYAYDFLKKTGTLPPEVIRMGFGNLGKQIMLIYQQGIMDRAGAENWTGATAAFQAAQYRGFQMQINTSARMEALNKRYEQMLLLNTGALEQENTQVRRGKYPDFNRFKLMLDQKTGDPDVVAFKAQLGRVCVEWAKLSSGALGLAEPSVAAQKKMDEILAASNNWEQLQANIQTIRLDAVHNAASFALNNRSIAKEYGFTVEGAALPDLKTYNVRIGNMMIQTQMTPEDAVTWGASATEEKHRPAPITGRKTTKERPALGSFWK